MIKLLATSIFLYTLALALGAQFLYNSDISISVLLGGLTMWANVLGLAFFWRLIFLKKSIALAVLTIIFKYLILALILWSLASAKWLNPAAFCVGLTALLFGVLVVLLKNSLTQKSES